MIALYYPDGVWLDTVNGTDGTVTGVNGIQTFPVKTIAAAYALCASLSLRMIHFTSGSNVTAVTLTQSASGWTFLGGGKIDLGSQSIADAVFTDVYSIYGVSTGDDATFYNCGIGSGGITLDHAYLTLCRLKGAITLIANADPIIFQDCIDATGAAADFELIFVANATAILRNLRGAVTLKSMASTNSVVIDGALRVTIDATSTAGSITVRGFAPALTGASTFTTLPNTGTITQDARYGVDVSVTLADDAITAAKFDETTAFPLKAADSGATAVGRVGTDTANTLTTLSDQADNRVGLQAGVGRPGRHQHHRSGGRGDKLPGDDRATLAALLQKADDDSRGTETVRRQR